MGLQSLYRQSGVVLVFSMVMLLLVSLVSINLLQENSTQIKMISNTGLQNQTFSNVESDLTQAETALAAIRLNAIGDGTCNNPNQLSEGGTINATNAQITGVYCVFNNREYRCLNSNYTAYDQASPDNVTACAKLAVAQCPTEIYKFNIALTDSTSGSARAIKSKFAVGCKVFL